MLIPGSLLAVFALKKFLTVYPDGFWDSPTSVMSRSFPLKLNAASFSRVGLMV